MTTELEQADAATRDLMEAAEQGFEDIARTDIAVPDESGEYRSPWDQQLDESDLMYGLFIQYRDQGLGRTIINGFNWYLEEEIGTAKKNSYYVYAKTWDWQERARLWDQYEEAQYQLARGVARRDMAERHEEKIVEAIGAIVVPFEALAVAMKDDAFLDELATMKPAKLIDVTNRAARALPSLMSAERLARGEATEIVAGTVEVNHNVTIGRDQIAEILGVLHQAGALTDGSPIGEYVEIDDAEVVDVYPVPAEGDGGSEATGDEPEADSVPDSPSP